MHIQTLVSQSSVKRFNERVFQIHIEHFDRKRLKRFDRFPLRIVVTDQHDFQGTAVTVEVAQHLEAQIQRDNGMGRVADRNE